MHSRVTNKLEIMSKSEFSRQILFRWKKLLDMLDQVSSSTF